MNSQPSNPASAVQHPRSMESSLALTAEDRHYLDQREAIINTCVRAGVAAARALHEIQTYGGGILWKKDFKTFVDYCAAKWGYKKSQAYRLADTGSFISELEDDFPPIGEKSVVPEYHYRQLCSVVPKEHRVECWLCITADKDPAELTAARIKSAAKKYLHDRGLDPLPKMMPERPMDNSKAKAVAMGVLDKLRAVVAYYPHQDKFERAFSEFTALIEQATGTHAIEVEATVSNLPPDSVVVNAGVTDSASNLGIHPVGPVAPAMKAPKPVKPALKDGPGKRPGSPSAPTGRPEETSTIPEHECHRAGEVPDEHGHNSYMSARLFYKVLRPGRRYEEWFAEIETKNPESIRISQDNVESISLFRARSVANNEQGGNCLSTFKLISDIINGGHADPGAVANELFKKELAMLVACHGVDGNGGAPQGEPSEPTIQPALNTAA